MNQELPKRIINRSNLQEEDATSVKIKFKAEKEYDLMIPLCED